MNTLRLLCTLTLLVSLGWAQKEVPMPKDLPAYGPDRPLQAPSVKVSRLSNGLTVWLVSEPGFPMLSYTVAVRGGLAADPADRPGLSELLSNTLDQGTRARSAKQVAQDIQAAGGDLSVAARRDCIEVSTTVLSSKADAALKVVSDILQNASFPDNEVTLAKRNLSDSLRQRESEPSFLAMRAMAKVLFANSPYQVVSPTQESITASTPADLRQIFAQRFRPDQAVFVAVGDFDNARMLELASTNFASWKNPDAAPVAAPARPSASPEHAIFIVQRPGSVQTTLQLGTFGPLRSDADFEAAEVANAIYGGTFSSRLTTNIREDKGYTYSPGARLSTYQLAATLVTRADVRNEVTGPSLNEITYELNRLATTSPSDEELAKAKRFLVGIEAIQLQSRGDVAHELATLWVDGLPPEEIGIYGKKIAETTTADVDTAAKKYFPASRTAIVAVGEDKVVRDALAPFGLPLRAAP